MYAATIQKIITEILGDKSGLTFGKDARDLLIDCSVEFVTLISSEANEIAEREAKKTIAAEHIDKALRELGFPEYVQEVLTSAGEHKEQLRVSESACPSVVGGYILTGGSDQGEADYEAGAERIDRGGTAPAAAGIVCVCHGEI
jgi:histone H3/H4